MKVKIQGLKIRKVASFEEASRLYGAQRDKVALAGRGGATQFAPAIIYDNADKPCAYVSYNGRVWPGLPESWTPQTLPLYESITPKSDQPPNYKQLVDDLQHYRTQKKRMEELEEQTRKKLLDGGKRRYRGSCVDAVVVDSEQVRLDTDKIRKDMSAEWIRDHEKHVPCTKIELEAHVPEIVL